MPERGPKEGMTRREFLENTGRAAIAATALTLQSDTLQYPSWKEVKLLPENDNVLFLTDIHSGNPIDNTTHMTTSRAADKLDNVLSHLEPEKFGAILNLADTYQDGFSRSKNIEKLNTILEVFPQNTTHTTGNHDLRGMTRQNLEQTFKNRGFSDKFYGVLKFPRTGIQIIYFDMLTPDGTNGTLPDYMIDFLLNDPENEIDTSYEIILAGHFGMVPIKNGRNLRHFSNEPKKTAYTNGEEVLTQMLRNGMPVIACIGGHIHAFHSETHTVENIEVPHFLLPSFTERTTTNNQTHIPGIFNILEISNEELLIASYFRGNQINSVAVKR